MIMYGGWWTESIINGPANYVCDIKELAKWIAIYIPNTDDDDDGDVSNN